MMAVSASQIVPAAAHVDGPVHGGGSDGVFAIAITLLAIEIGLPAGRGTTCQVTLLLPRLGGEDIGDSVMNGALVVSTSGVRFPVPARPQLIRHFARIVALTRQNAHLPRNRMTPPTLVHRSSDSLGDGDGGS